MRLKINKMRDLEFYPDNNKLQNFNKTNVYYQCIENVYICELDNSDLNKLMIFKR